MAWKPLGWRPQFVSEIDKFPCALLEQRHPETPNFGDMTTFKEWPDATIDVLVGGTPCQSFSVAGLRGGLADPRGNLMLTYLAIAARLSAPLAGLGERPRRPVHRTADGILEPSSEGWRNSGMGSPTEFLTLNISELAQRREPCVRCRISWRLATCRSGTF